MASQDWIWYSAVAALIGALFFSFRSAGHHRDPTAKPPSVFAGRVDFTPMRWRYRVLARVLGGVFFVLIVI